MGSPGLGRGVAQRLRIRMRGRAFAWVFSAVLVALLGLLLTGSLRPKTAAPDVRLTSLTGRAERLSALRGSVVLVNFWATSCAPCVREMPHLVTLHTQYAARGLRIWGVALPYDRPDLVADFTRRAALPFDVALDLDGEVARAFDHTEFAPTTFLIDRAGDVIKRYVGEFDVADLRQRIDNALAGQKPARDLPMATALPI
jgi:peroxiredoxin